MTTFRSRKLAWMGLATAGFLGFALAPSAHADGKELVCVNSTQLENLAHQSQDTRLRAKHAFTDAELGPDENMVWMADGLVADCLESGLLIHGSNGGVAFEPNPTEEECFDWAMNHLAGPPQNPDVPVDEARNCVAEGTAAYWACDAVSPQSEHPYDNHLVCEAEAALAEAKCIRAVNSGNSGN